METSVLTLYGDNTLGGAEMKPDLLVIYRFFHTFLLMDSLALMILSFGGDITPLQFTKSLLLFVPILLLYWIVRRFKSLFLFAVSGAASLAVLYFSASTIWERGAFTVCGVFLVLLYFFERAGSGESILVRPSYAGLLVFAGIYIYTLAYHRSTLGTILCINTGVYWLLTILSENRRSLLKLYEQNEKLHRFPRNRIAEGNRIALGGFCALIIAGMVFLPMSGFDNVLKKLGHLFLNMIRKLLAGLGGAEEMIPDEPQMAEQMPFFPGEFREASPFWQTFFQILEKVFIFLFLAAAVYLVCRILYGLYKKYHETAFADGDRVEFLSPVKVDKKESLKREKRRSGLFSARSLGEKIRRCYKRKIESSMEQKIREAFTPEQIEADAGLTNAEGVEEFHRIYEKARYGKEDCRQEEWGRMKELGKRL